MPTDADVPDGTNLSFHLSGLIADHRRNLERVGKIETLPILQICSRSSQTIEDIYDFEFSLSLVFICRENPRRSGILLFPDRPRFCRLMKTQHRRYPRSSGMNGDKSGESGVFLFPDASQISAVVGDHSRQMKTQICTVGDGFRRGRISLITNPLNCWAPVPAKFI